MLRKDGRVKKTVYLTREVSQMLEEMHRKLNRIARSTRKEHYKYVQSSEIVDSAVRRLYEEKFARTPSYVIPGAEPHSTEDVVDEPLTSS